MKGLEDRKVCGERRARQTNSKDGGRVVTVAIPVPGVCQSDFSAVQNKGMDLPVP